MMAISSRATKKSHGFARSTKRFLAAHTPPRRQQDTGTRAERFPFFIAPYNAQVRLAPSSAPGKRSRRQRRTDFRGQEAPGLDSLSLCSSYGEYGSRGLAFILDRKPRQRRYLPCPMPGRGRCRSSHRCHGARFSGRHDAHQPVLQIVSTHPPRHGLQAQSSMQQVATGNPR